MRVSQQQEVGKQSFIIHPRLAEFAEKRLATRCDSESPATLLNGSTRKGKFDASQLDFVPRSQNPN